MKKILAIILLCISCHSFSMVRYKQLIHNMHKLNTATTQQNSARSYALYNYKVKRMTFEQQREELFKRHEKMNNAQHIALGGLNLSGPTATAELTLYALYSESFAPLLPVTLASASFVAYCRARQLKSHVVALQNSLLS